MLYSVRQSVTRLWNHYRLKDIIDTGYLLHFVVCGIVSYCNSPQQYGIAHMLRRKCRQTEGGGGRGRGERGGRERRGGGRRKKEKRTDAGNMHSRKTNCFSNTRVPIVIHECISTLASQPSARKTVQSLAPINRRELVRPHFVPPR